MSRTATVFIVDDDPATRRALQIALERANIRTRTYPDAKKFLDDYRDGLPGCLLLDLRLPVMSGIEVIEHLRARKASLPVIIITGHADVQTAVKSLKLGAADYLQKPLNTRDIVERVREAIRNHAAIVNKQSAAAAIRNRIARLTPREKMLVRMLVEGKSNKMIGGSLGISTKTVANHRAHIMAKMEATNAADLVRMIMTVDQAALLDGQVSAN